MKINPRKKRYVSPFLAWGDFHARSRFACSTTPEGKWGTTRSLSEGRHCFTSFYQWTRRVSLFFKISPVVMGSIFEKWVTGFGGGWKGGYSTKFYTGRLRSEVQPLTLLYTSFDRKVLPLCIPSID